MKKNFIHNYVEEEVKYSNIPLRVGTEVQIFRKLSDNEIKATSKLIGWESDNFILTTMPIVNRVPLFTQENDKCTVNFFHDGNIISFISSINKILSSGDLSFLVLKYPTHIKRADLRRFKRFNIFSPGTLLFESGASEKCNVVDLSMKGAKINIATKQTIESRQRLKVNFTLGNGVVIEELKLIVRHCTEVSKGIITFGCEFETDDRSGNDLKIMKEIKSYLGSAIL